MHDIRVDISIGLLSRREIPPKDTTLWSNECFTIEGGGSRRMLHVYTDISFLFTKTSRSEVNEDKLRI
jgi:hypothetical protein